ncbi:hypothetical protein N7488_011063 [Penicillium malachiteum]|nr:hypothetical protein N7488_011063 [Penicillium malachiteum]
MTDITPTYDLFSKIQHICINPCNALHLVKISEFLLNKCIALCTIVVVAPWLVPTDTDQYDPNIDWISPYENWSQFFSRTRSPTQVDLVPLLNAVDQGRDENDVRLAAYRSKLERAVRRLPDPLPEHLQLIDSFAWRFLRTLNKLQSLIEKSVASPRLYLRTCDEVRVRVEILR